MCDACDSPWVLYGAMVGGPDATDCWNDDRANWERNEVALDYNAPVPGLLAWLVESEGEGESEMRGLIAGLVVGRIRTRSQCPRPRAHAHAKPARTMDGYK